MILEEESIVWKFIIPHNDAEESVRMFFDRRSIAWDMLHKRSIHVDTIPDFYWYAISAYGHSYSNRDRPLRAGFAPSYEGTTPMLRISHITNSDAKMTLHTLEKYPITERDIHRICEGYCGIDFKIAKLSLDHYYDFLVDVSATEHDGIILSVP